LNALEKLLTVVDFYGELLVTGAITGNNKECFLFAASRDVLWEDASIVKLLRVLLSNEEQKKVV
jgi:hypothetical protein